MNQIDWQCDKYMNLAEPQLQFLRFYQLWDLQEIVKAPTRDRSCLDIILMTNSERFGKVTIVAPINSDHDTVLCEIRLQRKSFKSQPVRLEPCFQIADYGAISHVLMSTDWRLIVNNCITVNDYWMALYTYLTQFVHRFVPFKRRSDHGKQGQIARPVRKMLLAKLRAWRWWKLRPNPASKAEFNTASRRCWEAVRQCLAEQEDRLLKAG